MHGGLVLVLLEYFLYHELIRAFKSTVEHQENRDFICCTHSDACHAQGVLPLMAYMRRLQRKGVPFLGLKYMKG